MSVYGRKESGCSICDGKTIVKSNSLAVLRPDRAEKWHPTKNGDLTPYDVAPYTHKKVWWKCDKGDDHEWKGPISSDTNCPICSNYIVVESNCLANTHPEIVKEWHPTKNGDLTPYDVVGGSHSKAWWKCNKGDDHEWQSVIGSRAGSDKRSDSCPICSGRKVVESNCLATLRPQLALQWHPTKNSKYTPYNLTISSGRKVWWKCDKGEGHEWKTAVSNRTDRDSGCPFCTLTPQSRQELIITFELLLFFKNINPKGYKARINGKIRSLDIYIPSLNLGIEFDGTYFHKDKVAKDKLKTLQFKNDGFDIFRVRQQSKKDKLKKLTKNDVISKYPYNGKEVVNNVLMQIMRMYELGSNKTTKIKTYIAKKELQNEKGLDSYIEMILTEKAEKKK